jgi:transcriptional regulator with XRE-family HTH domain
MKSMAAIMATVNAQVNASRFVRAATGCPPDAARDLGVSRGHLIREELVTRRRGVARLARLVGCDHSHISRVLSGERKAGRDLQRKLARLGVSVGKEWR